MRSSIARHTVVGVLGGILWMSAAQATVIAQGQADITAFSVIPANGSLSIEFFPPDAFSGAFDSASFPTADMDLDGDLDGEVSTAASTTHVSASSSASSTNRTVSAQAGTNLPSTEGFAESDAIANLYGRLMISDTSGAGGSVQVSIAMDYLLQLSVVSDALGIYDSTVFVGLYMTDGVNDFFLSGLENFSGAGPANPGVALAGTLADSWLLDYDVFYDFVLTADVEHTSTTDIVPEPASGTLLLVGVGLVWMRRFKPGKGG